MPDTCKLFPFESVFQRTLTHRLLKLICLNSLYGKKKHRPRCTHSKQIVRWIARCITQRNKYLTGLSLAPSVEVLFIIYFLFLFLSKVGGKHHQRFTLRSPCWNTVVVSTSYYHFTSTHFQECNEQVILRFLNLPGIKKNVSAVLEIVLSLAVGMPQTDSFNFTVCDSNFVTCHL